MLGYYQPRDSHVHGWPWRGLTISERSLAGTHGHIGALLTLFAVRSCGDSFHSQADSHQQPATPYPATTTDQSEFQGAQLTTDVQS